MLRTAPRDAGPAANAALFADGLRDEHTALVAFTGMLQFEQDALVRGDADRVAQLAVDKAVQIELLSHLGELRSRHLASENLPGSAEGMLAWLRRNPGFAAAVRKLWNELLAQAETARQINQVNGQLIENQLQQNRLRLAVLRSVATPDGVYRADGQLRPLRNATSLRLV